MALARQMLREDPQATSHRISEACKAQYGGGLCWESIGKIRAEMGQTAPAKVVVPRAIEEVVVPPEIQEAPVQMLAPAAPTIPAVVPNGTTASFQNIQAWMQQNQAEQVILNKDGQCSVLAWHHFNVGGSTNG